MLRIGRQQLEIGARILDELSLSWDSVDVDVAPRAWVDWQPRWREDAHPALRHAVGQVVREVHLTEHLFTTELVHPPDPKRRHAASTWLLGGVWLELDHGHGHQQVFNALDENGLAEQPPATGPDLRVLTP